MLAVKAIFPPVFHVSYTGHLLVYLWTCVLLMPLKMRCAAENRL